MPLNCNDLWEKQLLPKDNLLVFMHKWFCTFTSNLTASFQDGRNAAKVCSHKKVHCMKTPEYSVYKSFLVLHYYPMSNSRSSVVIKMKNIEKCSLYESMTLKKLNSLLIKQGQHNMLWFSRNNDSTECKLHLFLYSAKKISPPPPPFSPRQKTQYNKPDISHHWMIVYDGFKSLH